MLLSLSRTASLEPWKQKEFSVPEITRQKAFEFMCQRVWSHIIWRDGNRVGDNFIEANYLVLDYDERLSIKDVRDQLEVRGLGFVMGTTKSHQKSKNGQPPRDRFRVIIPFKEPITCPLTYRQNMRRFLLEFQSDPQCGDLARCWQPFREIIAYQEGAPMEWKTYRKPRASRYEKSALPPPWFHAVLKKIPGPGERNAHAFRVAAMLAQYGYSENQILGELTSGKIDLPERELRVCAKSGFKAGVRNRTSSNNKSF